MLQIARPQGGAATLGLWWNFSGFGVGRGSLGKWSCWKGTEETGGVQEKVAGQIRKALGNCDRQVGFRELAI